MCIKSFDVYIQDLFHVSLDKFEMAIFLLFFQLFIIFFLHYVSVILKKTETTSKIVLSCFLFVLSFVAR